MRDRVVLVGVATVFIRVLVVYTRYLLQGQSMSNNLSGVDKIISYNLLMGNDGLLHSRLIDF
jgi:hypothetical protein